jgi:hypothetical protein
LRGGRKLPPLFSCGHAASRPETWQHDLVVDGFADQFHSHVELHGHGIAADQRADHPRPFGQFDQQHGIGRVLLEGRARRAMHHAEGVHDAATAGGAMFEGLAAAWRQIDLLVELHVAAGVAVLQQQRPSLRPCQ